MISAIYNFALTTGANRVIKGARIEHVCGDPSLPPHEDFALRCRLVARALDALASERGRNVSRPVGARVIYFRGMDRGGRSEIIG